MRIGEILETCLPHYMYLHVYFFNLPLFKTHENDLAIESIIEHTTMDGPYCTFNIKLLPHHFTSHKTQLASELAKQS